MFKRASREEPQMSAEDRTYQWVRTQLHHSFNNMLDTCKEIIIHQGCANMLPDGADKNYELDLIATLQNRLHGQIAIHDDIVRTNKHIDTSKLVYYTDVSPVRTSHETLATAWQWANKELFKW